MWSALCHFIYKINVGLVVLLMLCQPPYLHLSPYLSSFLFLFFSLLTDLLVRWLARHAQDYHVDLPSAARLSSSLFTLLIIMGMHIVTTAFVRAQLIANNYRDDI